MSDFDRNSGRTQYPPEIIPPGQERPLRLKAKSPIELYPVTSLLVGANIAVFIAMVLSGVSASNPTLQQILFWGADHGPYTLGAQPWRLITSVFLHIGILHLAFNMWALWNLGVLTEMILGHQLYLASYLLAGVAGNLLSIAWHPNVVGAGASGAIFGLAGVVISVLKLANLPVPQTALRGTLRSVVSFAIYNLLFGTLGSIDNAAHLGGFLCGLAIGALLSWISRAKLDNRALLHWITIAFVALLLLAGFVSLRSSFERTQKGVDAQAVEWNHQLSASCITLAPTLQATCNFSPDNS